ncbi:molybdenum cofactor guanylyltransferase [Novosphingobium flavum]|uniref:Molybdenum cofactor guanylyltransferase n=1 Tax=Novosphingobium flavum TaxID=1778672 RepID=A0A7X1FRW1_9SPHN|nr:molybdenum cofactor guanylyltransferase [Novosphingobium flavum]MBC2665839.1 molybdenum cofactor guanylyltransferase [Novosphingobium flavum]
MDKAGILGAVLAGGQSSRFGSDKALAEIGGHSLLQHAVDQLSHWCGAVIAVGREAAPVPVVADWPDAGLGPLGGIAAALRHGRNNGFAAVLTVGVDSLGLPENLPDRLRPGPAYVKDQPVVGLWPIDALDAVEAILLGDGRHSMLAFAEAVSARGVRLAEPTINVNRPEDLAAITLLPRGPAPE